MRNPDFKKSALASVLALASALLLLTISCVLPEVVICGIYDRASPMLELAVGAAEEEDYLSAAAYAKEALTILNNNSGLMMLLFEHNEVYELLGAAESAYRIAKKEDAAQLLEELCSAATILKAMRQMNEASFVNLF